MTTRIDFLDLEEDPSDDSDPWSGAVDNERPHDTGKEVAGTRTGVVGPPDGTLAFLNAVFAERGATKVAELEVNVGRGKVYLRPEEIDGEEVIRVLRRTSAGDSEVITTVTSSRAGYLIMNTQQVVAALPDSFPEPDPLLMKSLERLASMLPDLHPEISAWGIRPTLTFVPNEQWKLDVDCVLPFDDPTPSGRMDVRPGRRLACLWLDNGQRLLSLGGFNLDEPEEIVRLMREVAADPERFATVRGLE